MILEKVISGGQDGADVAGWRAAKAAGLATGGWMPRGWRTESGPRPGCAELFGAREHPSPFYPPRTRANVRDSDGTLIFAVGSSPGIDLTIHECECKGKPYRLVMLDPAGRVVLHPARMSVDQIAEWIAAGEFRVLNVVGTGERKAPGIGDRVERYLAEVFAELRRGRP